MKNILLLTDFSENSWNSIIYALAFFKKIKCNFFILHVSSITDSTTTNNALIGLLSRDDYLKGIQHNMEVLIKKIEKQPINLRHSFKPIIQEPPFIGCIKKIITRFNIYFIVMGKKGSSRLKRLVVGSNTDEVVNKMRCPILVVPENTHFVTPANIIFPTDYNTVITTNMVKTITDLLITYKPIFRIIHITSIKDALTNFQKDNKKKLHKDLHPIEHSFHTFNNFNIEETIEDFIEEQKANLIIMIAKNQNILQRIFIRPNIQRINYHILVPFLILHE